MKTSIKLAALGAVALAATSTAALAGSELAPGITTGLTIGAPLPEGVYDISIGSYGGQGAKGTVPAINTAVAVPVWLVWWTPWQIAGGRIMFDTNTAVADMWNPGANGTTSALNTLVEAGIGWNFGNGWNATLHAGAWLPSSEALPTLLGRDYTAFQGAAAVSYIKDGWALSATGVYGTGGDKVIVTGLPTSLGGALPQQQADWLNLDLTAVKHFGKFETGAVAYGSWDLSDSGVLTCGLATHHFAACKQSQFAVGSLVGYHFGHILVQAKLTTDIMENNYTSKETRGWLNVVMPLWVPSAEGPLK